MADLFGRLERLPATLRELGLSDDDVREVAVWNGGTTVRLKSMEVLRRVCPGCEAKVDCIWRGGGVETYAYMVDLDGVRLRAEEDRIASLGKQTVTL